MAFKNSWPFAEKNELTPALDQPNPLYSHLYKANITDSKKKKKKAIVQLLTYIWMIYQLHSNDKLSSISPSISVYSMRLPGFKIFQNIVLDIVHGTKNVLINM